jgi:uncharacterized protein (DUF488 family)
MRPSEGPCLLSVGYERRQIDELIGLLVDARVDVLVDVRLNAISRKRGFSKRALASALSEAGIEYRHERELGNPKDNREAFRAGTASARRRYLNHLGNGASSVLDAVIDLADRSRVALLCYEREHRECHRSCITSEANLRRPGLEVQTL